MKRNAADQDHVVVFDKPLGSARSVCRRGFAETDDLHQVTRVVIERLDPLGDKRRQDRGLFIVGHLSMNAGREDNADVEGVRAVGDQSPDEQIYDLAAAV